MDSTGHREIDSELARIDSDYKRLLKHVKENEALLAQKDKEIEDLISKLRNDISERNQGNSDEAAEYLRNADKVLHSVDNKPHEKFFPKRFEIFFNSLKDGRQLFRAGLFEAAAAVAISARSGLERLSYNIDDKVEEWKKIFDLFSTKLENLREKINHEISEWGKITGNHSRAENIIAINYWSKDEFASVVETSKKYREFIKAFTQIGNEEYIKHSESPSTDELRKFIDDIDEADRKLSALSKLYTKRYAASCERSDYGEKIIEFMTDEINLTWLEELTGYKNPSAEIAEAQDYIDYMKTNFKDQNINQDFREWLKIVFLNSSGDNIYVYIIPVETDENVVNQIILHIDYNKAENEIYSRDIHQHLCEAVNNNITVEYANDTDSLKFSENNSYRETGIDIEKMKSKN